MYSRTLEARSSGPIEVSLEGHQSNIEFVVDNGCSRARVEAYTDVSSGPTVELIDSLSLSEGRDGVSLTLPEEAGGGMVVTSYGNNFSSMSIGGGVVVSGGNIISTGRGSTDVTVNGQRIQIRGDKTYINGRLVDGNNDDSPAGDPPSVVHLRAVLPAGSVANGKTYNGNVTADNVGKVRLKTYNGNVRAVGLTEDSTLKSYNGDIIVGAASGSRPVVDADTYNGDIRALDDNLRLRPSTYNGDVRYPR